ncbi:MAG: ATP-binding cassette domain-containing protein [Flavobacteriales bacterium]|nr:ATP-binding cassette domain-containing protein [Flavobacteriales bacterium]MDG1934343.1 ATP-binding cassette domain-containing protein [Flavobacteriales bacterium]
MANNLLIVKNVDKRYGDYTALSEVNISVPKGSIYGLLGPNGAGKTTLMRIINQITAPDSGEVIFDGVKLQKDHISNIGYMPEERGLYKKMKVGEQVLYLAQLKGMPYKEANAKLKFWFKKLDIFSWWNKKVEELSKGMAQKIQFVVTVIHDPKLLIFDEPFSGFDPINASIIRKEILELRDSGKTIIFSTHRMESVEEICDHIGLINKSKTIFEGPIEEIKKQFTNNTFDLEVKEKDLKQNNLFESVDYNKYHQIKLKENVDLKEVLHFINKNHEVISFKKNIPSMEEIFIKVVEDA